MIDNIEKIKIAAILHDIGKPEAWISGNIKDHAGISQKIARYIGLDNEISEMILRHHGSSLSDGYPPLRTGEEGMHDAIVSVANIIASGAERPLTGGEAEEIKIRDPISGSAEIKEEEYLRREFERLKEELKSKLLQNGVSYNSIYEILENSFLNFIPADTTANDHSLWDHLKLTSAIAHCLAIDGYKGKNSADYSIALIAGDVNGIQDFITQSMRLRDLRAGSRIVEEATEEATRAISKNLSGDHIIFRGGGNFLAIAPTSLAEQLKEECEKRFYDYIKGGLDITVDIYTCKRIDESVINEIELPKYRDMIEKWKSSDYGFSGNLMQYFGVAWYLAGKNLRKSKLAKKTEERYFSVVRKPCDICGREALDQERISERDRKLLRTLPLDASPREENLCRICLWKRTFAEGISFADLAEKGDGGYIALLKADGDNVGDFVFGIEEEEIPSPSRQLKVSKVLDEAAKGLKEVVEKFDGGTIFCGGDDLLAVLPANKSFECAKEVYNEYLECTKNRINLSAGLLIMPLKFPLYMGLEMLNELLRLAKETKNKIAFQIVQSGGITVTPKAWNWKEFENMIGLAEDFAGAEGRTKLFHIRNVMRKDGVKGAFHFLRYLEGRAKSFSEVQYLDRILKEVEKKTLSYIISISNIIKAKE
jgi:CRISPR/Cas system-associated protein Cas10 (large subunit of type III CRISPR-Cas system)